MRIGKGLNWSFQAGEGVIFAPVCKTGESLNAVWKQFFIVIFHDHNWIFKGVSYVYRIDGSYGHLEKLIVYGCSLQVLAPGDFGESSICPSLEFQCTAGKGWFRASTGSWNMLLLTRAFIVPKLNSAVYWLCLLFQTFQGEIWLPGTDINFLCTENCTRYLARTSLSLGLVSELLEAVLQVRTGCKLVFTFKTDVFRQFVATFS